MKKKIAIKVGQRFEIYGSEYEICFVDKNKVRYSSVIGGKIFNVRVCRTGISYGISYNTNSIFPTYISVLII